MFGANLLFSAVACNRINEGMDLNIENNMVVFAAGNLIGVQLEGKPLRTLKGEHTERVTSVKHVILRGDGDKEPKEFIISGSVDKKVVVWRINGNEFSPVTLTGHEFGIVSIGVFRNGKQLLFASSDSGSNIKIWKQNTDTIECIQTIKITPHQAMTLQLDYLPGTHSIAILIFSSRVALWGYGFKYACLCLQGRQSNFVITIVYRNPFLVRTY
jgi:WD40 repeat protein